MKNYYYLLLILLATACGSADKKDSNSPESSGINVYQDGKTIRSKSNKFNLKRKEFSFIFTFSEVPPDVDTTIMIYYWATTDVKMIDKFRKAKDIDSVSVNIGGINLAPDNDDASITLNMKLGHSGLLFQKNGKTKDIFHSFANVDREENTLYAWYKVNQFFDCDIDGYTRIEDIQSDKLLIYFSWRDNETSNEVEGNFIEIEFEK